MKNIIKLKKNEFLFSDRCGSLCNCCENCTVLVVRTFENYNSRIPFFVISR